MLYSVIKQFALSLPGEGEKLEFALESADLPEALYHGARAVLRSAKPLEARLTCAHLMALVRETQRGTCWQVRQADHYVAPAGGTRPGAIPAADFLDLTFRAVLLQIRQAIQPLQAAGQGAFEKPVCRSASDADWDRAQSDLSFVDDIT
eukprot:481635-Pyramimonas_sp.AAC.1